MSAGTSARRGQITRPTSARRNVDRSVRAALSVLAGVMLYLTFEPIGWWWLAPVALAIEFVVLSGRSLRAALAYGVLFGWGLMVPLLWWTGEYVGPIGSLPLATLEALLVAATCAAIAAVSRLAAAPLWAALLWVAGEWFRSVFPFGGFAWGRLAFGQVDGVFLPLVAVAGIPLVAFAIALLGFSAASLWQRVSARQAFGWGAVLLAVGGVGLPLLSAWQATRLVEVQAEEGEVVVAVIQGNVPEPGLDFNSERRAVLDNHVQETLRLAEDIRGGRAPQPDVVIWPENSSDIDPLTNTDAARRIQRSAEEVGVPILVGAVLGGGGPSPRNVVLLWDPEAGPVDSYTKRRLQPFGETMPFRGFFRVFSSEVDRAGNFVPGNDANALTVGTARIAINLCYEVLFDDAVRDTVRGGANLLAVPSNNATFGYTDMTYQQLAMDRVRAVEHSRAVIVSTTSGVSAIVNPDGRVLQQSGMFTPATLLRTVPLRSSVTIADRVGSRPEWLMASAGLLSVGFSTVAWCRRPRSGAHRHTTHMH